MRGLAALTFSVLLAAGAVQAQPPTTPGATDALAFLDGRWEGEGWSIDRVTRKRENFRHVEQVTSRLRGGLRVVEGQATDSTGGPPSFSALGVLSAKGGGGYQLHSYSTLGGGTFAAEAPRPGVLVWTIPAGPGRVVYEITVRDGVWEETGNYVGSDAQPRQFFFMRLRRTGDAG